MRLLPGNQGGSLLIKTPLGTADLQVIKYKTGSLGESSDRARNHDRGEFEGTGELYLPDGQIAVSGNGKYLKRNLKKLLMKLY